MVKKGALSWKGFYKHERNLEAAYIDERIASLIDAEDPEVQEIIDRGGILSFPHTILEGSLDPIIRTVKALMNSDKEKVIAIAVLHYGNHGPFDEFSLDTFEYVFNRIKNQLGLEYPVLERVYPPFSHESHFDEEKDRLEQVMSEVDWFRNNVNGSTAVVITGDLCHYGMTYGLESEDPDIQKLIDDLVVKGLDLLYKEDDILNYLEFTKESKNDQRVPGIIVKELLGDNLDYKIFQRKISEYTDVLEMDTPHYVASYFYGAWKN